MKTKTLQARLNKALKDTAIFQDIASYCVIQDTSIAISTYNDWKKRTNCISPDTLQAAYDIMILSIKNAEKVLKQYNI